MSTNDVSSSCTVTDAATPAGFWRRLGPAARALRHRNYRLFFTGQGLSLIGSWTQRVALQWLVFHLTGSELLLGVVAFTGQVPTFLLAPFAGVLADRTDRRRLLIATQTLAMLQAFALAALTVSGVVAVWHIVALSIVLGLVNAFDIPTRQSFVVEMLESKEDLPNAIALNSFLVNGARLIGPTMAGVLIAAYGEGTCFLINGATFLAVICALLLMRTTPAVRAAGRTRLLQNLREGFSYAFHFLPIRAILLLLATISLLGSSYAVLMPVFAKEILQGGPKTLGVLMAASGVGAIIGAGFLAARKSVRGLGKVMVAANCLFGLALIAFSCSRNLYVSMALLVAAGCGMMIQLASSNSLLQTLVDDDKRGRVMSLYVMAFMGMTPFGGLLAGAVAHAFGAPTAVAIGGTGCIAAAVLFATRLPKLGRLAHPTYIRLGLASDAVDGDGSTEAPPPPDVRL